MKTTIVQKRHHAAFHNGTQITAWTTDRNRTYTALRRSLGIRHGVYIDPKSKRAVRMKGIRIHSKIFIEKRGE